MRKLSLYPCFGQYGWLDGPWNHKEVLPLACLGCPMAEDCKVKKEEIDGFSSETNEDHQPAS